MSNEKRAETVKINGGADYAKVAERLRLFREACPRGLIETTPTIMADGRLMFKARVLKDKADPSSAEASAHSLATKTTGDKLFEKHESVAVGRALALLGYLASGEIASSEEMEDYEEYREEKRQTEETVFSDQLNGCKSVEELGKVWSALPAEMKVSLVAVKDAMKAKLQHDEVSDREEAMKEALKADGAMFSSDVRIEPDADKIAQEFGGEVIEEESVPAKLMKQGMKKAKTSL